MDYKIKLDNMLNQENGILLESDQYAIRAIVDERRPTFVAVLHP